MNVNYMDNNTWIGTNSTLELSAVVFFYVLFKITWSDVPGIVTVAAGISTVLLNVYRWVVLKNKKKNDERDSNEDGTA